MSLAEMNDSSGGGGARGEDEEQRRNQHGGNHRAFIFQLEAEDEDDQ